MCQINQLSASLSEALLHSLWQGLLISLLLGLVLKLLNNASAHKRYLVATSALFLQVLLFAGSFYMAYQQALPLNNGSYTTVQNFEEVIPAELSNQEEGYFSLLTSGVDTTVLFFKEYHSTICLLWLVGVLGLSFRLFAGLFLVSKITKSGIDVPQHWQQRLKELASTMGIKHKVHLVVSKGITVPSLTGWLKPIIIIPVSVLSHLPPEEVEAILAHELAHVKRHDYLINILQHMVEITMFFNPFVWWMSNLINEEREHCCDDLAIKTLGNHKAYIHALANLTVHLNNNKNVLSEGVLAATGKKDSVIYRIKRIMKKANKKQEISKAYSRDLSGGFTAYLAVLAFISFALIFSVKAQERKIKVQVSEFNENDSVKKEIKIYELSGSDLKVIERDTSLEAFYTASKVTIKELNKGSASVAIDQLNDSEDSASVRIRVLKTDSAKFIIRDDNSFLKQDDDIIAIDKIEPTENIKGSIFISYPDTSSIRVIKLNSKDSNTSSQKQQIQEKLKPLFVVNGKKVVESKIKDLDPNEIKSINVYKGENAIARYGKEGKHGVIEITLKGFDNKEHTKEKRELKGSGDMLYLVDGEPVSKNKYEKIEPEQIATINVWKGKFATEKYGEKAKNGVVEIHLKKQVNSTKSEIGQEETKKITEENPQNDFRNSINIFPNPSKNLFNINFILEKNTEVKVSVHDLNGKEVSLLANRMMSTGFHQLQWNADSMAKGLYLVNIFKDGELFKQKIILE